MKRSRFSEEQIIGILKEHEAGVPVAELCRKHGVSDASIYKWKARFGGIEVSEAKRLKTLEDENTVRIRRGPRHLELRCGRISGWRSTTRRSTRQFSRCFG
jgi:putative transposase